jgi:CSLREA domain-containing protein
MAVPSAFRPHTSPGTRVLDLSPPGRTILQVGLLLVTFLVLLAFPTPARADTFVVNTPDDSNDGQCDPVHCSLREAIIATINHPGPDTIAFGLPGTPPFTILAGSPLPAVTDGGTVIDATTQPGYSGAPVIMLQMGFPTPPGEQFPGGITLASGGNVVRGLSIVGFEFDPGGNTTCGYESKGGGGVVILSGSGNIVEDNFLGLTPSGAAMGNTDGIFLHPNGYGNTLQDNVISANECGIMALGNGQAILGNRIGTDPSGTSAVGNTRHGIFVSSYNNTIGAPGHGNLISGNAAMATSSGIFLATELGTPSGNVMQGNLIGTDISGASPLPNDRGILYIDGDGSQIGGLGAGEGNVVAFNLHQGIEPEGAGHIVEGNEIFQNGTSGVDINGPTIIRRNRIYDNGGLGIHHGTAFGPLPPSLGVPNSSTVVGTACPGCVVEFFLAAPDPTGAGEGKEYLGDTTASLDGTFFAELPIGIKGCDRITATATDGTPMTSMFAINAIVQPCVSLKWWNYLPWILIPLFVGGGLGGFLCGRRHPPDPGRVRFGWRCALAGAALGGMAGGLMLYPFSVVSDRGSAEGPADVGDLFGKSATPTHPGPPQPRYSATPTPTATYPYHPSGVAPTSTPVRAAEFTSVTRACEYVAKVNLFCRAGPGGDYKDLDSLTPGQMAPVVGQSTDGNYWYVLGPLSGRECTVPQAERFGETSGDCDDLPRFTPAPLPTRAPTPTDTATPVGAVGGG